MTNSALFAEAKRFIPGGVNSPVRAFRNVGGEPFFVAKAKGSRIWDVEGREYIDYVGTWGPAILGHAPEVVVEAVREAAKGGLSFGIPNPLEVEMARLLCTWVPSLQKVRMVNSGTEATMSCIRLARGFTGRKLIVKFEGCYHGHVDSLLVKAGSGALTHGNPDSAGVPSEFAQLTITIPFNNAEILAETFDKFGCELAAVIVEAVPANAGLFLPRPGFYEELRRLCSASGALLIFDEVMTGFRVAKGGYQELSGIMPDLTALGKVIGGGLPIGAFGGRSDVMDYLSPEGPVYQAGTLSGNPLAMTAGLAQLRELYLYRTQLGARGLDALLQAPDWPGFRVLDLHSNPLHAEGTMVLARSPRTAPLLSLDERAADPDDPVAVLDLEFRRTRGLRGREGRDGQ